MGRVLVVDYDPAWPAIFEQIRTRLWEVLSDVATAVEHVGSTAVPGLAAKPVIDIDIVVPKGRVPMGISGLEGIGYKHRGDLGILGREAFRTPHKTYPHHLYLCPEESPALANHLAVREYLRDHPGEARAYGELKKALAVQFASDIDGYVEGKTEFLLRVLERVGFEPGALDEIARMNCRD